MNETDVRLSGIEEEMRKMSLPLREKIADLIKDAAIKVDVLYNALIEIKKRSEMGNPVSLEFSVQIPWFSFLVLNEFIQPSSLFVNGGYYQCLTLTAFGKNILEEVATERLKREKYPKFEIYVEAVFSGRVPTSEQYNEALAIAVDVDEVLNSEISKTILSTINDVYRAPEEYHLMTNVSVTWLLKRGYIVKTRVPPGTIDIKLTERGWLFLKLHEKMADS